MYSGERLSAGVFLASPNRDCVAVMGRTGTFEVYGSTKSVFKVTASNKISPFLLFQTDGNLVLYEAGGNRFYWASNLYRPKMCDKDQLCQLVLQNDCNLVAYKSAYLYPDTIFWSAFPQPVDPIRFYSVASRGLSPTCPVTPKKISIETNYYDDKYTPPIQSISPRALGDDAGFGVREGNYFRIYARNNPTWAADNNRLVEPYNPNNPLVRLTRSVPRSNGRQQTIISRQINVLLQGRSQLVTEYLAANVRLLDLGTGSDTTSASRAYTNSLVTASGVIGGTSRYAASSFDAGHILGNRLGK